MMGCRPVKEGDHAGLLNYFDQLSETTKSFFAPHPFDELTVKAICKGDYQGCQGFVVERSEIIVGYTVIKRGYSEGELYRFPGYSIIMDADRHFLLAPSVADSYQSMGIGSVMLRFIENHVNSLGGTFLVLWGGVQTRNQRAVRYYEKNGFMRLGTFHHEGLDNWDMVKELDR